MVLEKHELILFARMQNLPATGTKPELADRIADALSGSAPRAPSKRLTVSQVLETPLTPHTVVGARQASTQQLRAFFVEHIGPRFHFDIHMRTYLASENSKTLAQAIDHWHATRKASKPETLPQLEFVRFTKQWHLDHPASTAAECRAAWQKYKALPINKRT